MDRICHIYKLDRLGKKRINPRVNKDTKYNTEAAAMCRTTLSLALPRVGFMKGGQKKHCIKKNIR